MFFACAVAFLIIVLLYRALILSTLWSWFIVSAFNIADLEFAPALGIILIADILLKKVSRTRQTYKDFEGDWEALVKSFLFEVAFYTFLMVIGGIFYASSL